MGTTKEHFEKDIKIHADLKYLLHLPKDYNSTGKPFPMIVFLHGAGERGDNLDQVKAWGIANIVEHDSNFPFIVVSPQCPADLWWLLKIQELKGFIDEMKTKYNVDKSRVYLTGLSMGGFATWALAAQYPNDFAAIAPVCGGGEVRLAMHGAHTRCRYGRFTARKIRSSRFSVRRKWLTKLNLKAVMFNLQFIPTLTIIAGMPLIAIKNYIPGF